MALVRAKTSFVTDISGFNCVVSPADIYDATDPLVLSRPDMFELVTATARTATRESDPEVEQTTAAPGEKRQGTRRL